MARKKSSRTLATTGPVGFELQHTSWTQPLEWQQPKGFALRNQAQRVYFDQWPVDIVAFAATKPVNKTLLIVLGPLESVVVYKHLVAQLRDQYKLVFVSLPGFGQNMDVDFSGTDLELKSFAVFINYLINADEFKDDEMSLLGTSAAASVALETALSLPNRLKTLVLTGLAHRPSKIWQLLLSELSYRIEGEDYLDCADAALLYLVSDEILSKGRTWGVFRQYFKSKVALLTIDQRRCLKAVVGFVLRGDGLGENTVKETPTCPTLAFTGEYDHLSAPFEHARFIDACVNGSFATIDDADHLIHVEKPRVVASLLKTFLSGQDINDLPGVRAYPPQSFVALDRRRDPRYVASRPKIKVSSSQVVVPEDWEGAIPTELSARLRNINFSGCLLQLHDERFQIAPHARDLMIYLPQVNMTIKVLAFEQVNTSLRCLFLHEDYLGATGFKEELDYGEHFVDADLETDDFGERPDRDEPWLGAKRHGGSVF